MDLCSVAQQPTKRQGGKVNRVGRSNYSSSPVPRNLLISQINESKIPGNLMANNPFPFSPSILTSVVLPPRCNLQAWILKYWAPTPSSRSSATGLKITKFVFTPAASRSTDAQ